MEAQIKAMEHTKCNSQFKEKCLVKIMTIKGIIFNEIIINKMSYNICKGIKEINGYFDEFRNSSFFDKIHNIILDEIQIKINKNIKDFEKILIIMMILIFIVKIK